MARFFMNITICICCIMGSEIPQSLCMGVTPIRKMAMSQPPIFRFVTEQEGQSAQGGQNARDRNHNGGQGHSLRCGEANGRPQEVGDASHQKDEHKQKPPEEDNPDSSLDVAHFVGLGQEWCDAVWRTEKRRRRNFVARADGTVADAGGRAIRVSQLPSDDSSEL
jgi:hypothetical protein